MEPIERVTIALKHKEPDKVPIFLFMIIHGAKILNIGFDEYFSKAENVMRGQIALQEKYHHDCLYPFFYAAKEYEAFGGLRRIMKHGSPESGPPIFSSAEELLESELPSVQNPHLEEIAKAQRLLYEQKGDSLPIVNSIIAPLSLPVMLLGFEKWIEYIVDTPEIAKDVVRHLIDYSIDFSNYLIENHAAAVVYFNPVASNQMIRFPEYIEISYEFDRKYYSKVKGAAVYAMAGGRSTELMDVLANKVGIHGVVVSHDDNLAELKQKYGKRLILVGNLENISMIRWSEEETEQRVKNCINQAAKGGGYIIADHHGEIPFNVSDSTLHGLVKARDKWGVY